MTAAKFFVNAAGVYLGAFIDHEPARGIEVPTPPLDARQVWQGGAWSAAPAYVPEAVSRFQALAALHLAGHLDQVEQVMADPQTDQMARLAWANAQEFRRTSPTVAFMAGALELSEQQLDELFISAGQIEA